MNLFETGWKTFEKNCYPEGMTEDQRKQIYRAFTAGALVTFSSMMKIATLPEDAAVKEVTALETEIEGACNEQVAIIKQRN